MKEFPSFSPIGDGFSPIGDGGGGGALLQGGVNPIDFSHLADKPHHIPTCARWEHETWGNSGGKTMDDAIASYSHTGRDALPLTLIATSGANIVGMVSLWINDCPLRPDLTPWVASLYVSPAARGQGIGSSLFSRIEDQAVRLGIRRLYLMTQHSEAFYRTMGWETFDRIDGPGPMENAVLMRKITQGRPTFTSEPESRRS